MVLRFLFFCTFCHCLNFLCADPPEIAVVQPDAVFYNEQVELICTVTGGNVLRNITWTAPNGTLVLFTNQTAGANVSLSITRHDYGEYTCTASNEFGSTTKSVQVRHPGKYSLKLAIIDQQGEGGGGLAGVCLSCVLAAWIPSLVA